MLPQPAFSYPKLIASSRNLLKIESKTAPVFTSGFKLLKGQTLINAGQCVV